MAAFWLALAVACGSSRASFSDGTGADGADASAPSGADDSGGGLNLGGSSNGSESGSSTTGCDPTCGAAGGTCSGGVCTLVENPGNIASATQTQLQTGGSADSNFKWVYPYDGTVFPRGLLSPTLQFGGGAADAAAVHMTSNALDYTGYFKSIPPDPDAGPANVVDAGGDAGAVSHGLSFAISQAAWDAVTHAVGAKDVLNVSVTKISRTAVSGPLTESWTIAQGSVRGTIYYETYNSQISPGGLGIMKIEPGAKQPTSLKSGCGNVCHTASADGSTLVAATSLMTSASYDLKSGAATIFAPQNMDFAFGALYPNGSFLMSATGYRGSFFAGWTAVSQLFDTKTGASIAAPGWDGVMGQAGTPTFSPDGKQIAFVHEGKDSGHTLAKMDFAVATKTFSNLVDLATDSNAYVAWPSFTPDGKSVIYHAGSSASFETDKGASGDIYVVDIATKTVRRLDALDGYNPGGGTYLPANDPKLNFAPTVLPEAVGGYFWVVFTSHRAYGNLAPSMANSDDNGKLWVSAIDIGAAPGADASHPAFYLDGQELIADNLRGFWVLPACQQNGTSCTTGDQCCSGFCRATKTAGALSCVMKPVGCSNEYESCTTASDCCHAGDHCINGRCGSATPQ
jgi:hypothetical protein